MNEFLKDTDFLDYHNPAFEEFTREINKDQKDISIASQIYYLVRDSFLYDPYHLDLTHSGLKASNVLNKNRAWCVEKSSVMAACTRKFGIPSRLGYATVTNHIGVDKLTSFLKTDLIVFHGFVELYLQNRWIKCTPAFDKRICRISNVTPLDWDGLSDSLFQEFDKGMRFMEYKHFYGVFNDVPIKLMNSEMKKFYPHLFEEEYNSKEFSFKHLH